MFGGNVVVVAMRQYVNYGLGVCFLRLKSYERALCFFNWVLKHNPRHVGALYNKSWTLSRLGRFEEAVSGYTEVTALAPLSAAAHLGRADALQHLGQHEHAIQEFNAALDIEPNSAL